jgi:hypothetical protein
MKKLFVSVPMKCRTETEIKASIAKMKAIAEAYEGEELELIDSYVEDTPPANNHQAIWYLGKSLEKLSTADIFIGIDDLRSWNGCLIEAETANRYGIKSYRVPAPVAIENYYALLTQGMTGQHEHQCQCGHNH